MASPASAPHADVLGERGKALARSLQSVLSALDRALAALDKLLKETP